MSISPTDCVSAREYVSVQLDGELPELELDRLETHLRFCPDCSAWADQVQEVTHRLRGAELEVPAAAGSFAYRRRTRRLAVSSAVVLASAAAVVATMFVTPGGRSSSLTRGGTIVLRPATGQRVAVPRLLRLEDGRLSTASTDTASQVSFRPSPKTPARTHS